jgi:hypothetical protein
MERSEIRVRRTAAPEYAEPPCVLVELTHGLSAVMPGLVPGIHVLHATSKAWMAGTSLDKPGHDERRDSR